MHKMFFDVSVLTHCLLIGNDPVIAGLSDSEIFSLGLLCSLAFSHFLQSNPVR